MARTPSGNIYVNFRCEPDILEWLNAEAELIEEPHNYRTSRSRSKVINTALRASMRRRQSKATEQRSAMVDSWQADDRGV